MSNKITVQLRKESRAGYDFVVFDLLGQKVTIDRSAKPVAGKLIGEDRKTLVLDPAIFQLYGIPKGKYVNLNLGLTKEMKQRLESGDTQSPVDERQLAIDEALPF